MTSSSWGVILGIPFRGASSRGRASVTLGSPVGGSPADNEAESFLKGYLLNLPVSKKEQAPTENGFSLMGRKFC